jgi:hypothetical protein
MASHIMSVAVERAMVAGEEVQGADRLRVVLGRSPPVRATAPARKAFSSGFSACV